MKRILKYIKSYLLDLKERWEDYWDEINEECNQD
jgi:hypothetical protein